MERIREARKAAGLTQKQLAEKIGVKHVSVSYYENGTVSPTYDQIQAIADATGVSVGYLLGIGEESAEQSIISARNAKVYFGVSEGVEKILESIVGKKRYIPINGKKIKGSITVYGEGKDAVAFAYEEDKELITHAVAALVESLIHSLGKSPEFVAKMEEELINSNEFISQFIAAEEKWSK